MNAVHPGWRSARRILCVRLDSLGDVLMCTPALRALRAALPGRRLTLLGSSAGAAALPFIPELDDVIVHAAPWMKSAATDPAGGNAGPGTAAAARTGQADLALVDTLAARAFDGAVIFTTYTQSALPAALLCHLAGIPLCLAHCRENPYRLLSDWVPDPEPASTVRHEVQRQLALVGHVGCRPGDLGLSFVPRAADRAAAIERLRGAGIDPGRPWILLHPGASAASRRYPAGHWAQVIALLSAATDVPLVLAGSAADVELVEDIRRRAGLPLPALPTLAGRLVLGELGAALRMAAVAVTNNSGPAHIAAAVGTPLVDLYALTNPQHTPWGTRSRVLFHDVPCRFCFKSTCPQGHHDCLAGVAPRRVAEAVLDLLQRGTAGPPTVLAEATVPAGDG
ncbi:glycosyltransferase family 9 protein [Herbaspirillum sp. SJZ107]|uniref:glycosyltransferase family 9 protein n=1 Tax=Herbaspirillum sp. SJZ107 TaxID=2572881 RepID=UPI00114FC3F2|nr:glycosyltransferase family 9 protein [Herbaspirillum sp. SJZ107]TQK07861.1 lipopolysaccharide heptosyltransferase II [Herbaspirillum sp. SJZ107]